MDMQSTFSRRLIVLAAVIGGFSIFAGCASVEQGTAKTVAFVRGDLSAALEDGYDASVKATRGALTGMQFSIESERGDALQTEFLARTALDKKIEVLVTRRSAKETGVRIRVGAFGDEAVAQSLLTEIQDRL